MRRFQRVTFGLALGTVLTLTAPSSPAAARPPISYVAMGDSYSSGVGTRSYDIAGAPCLLSSRSYAALWATRHPVRSFAFVACSGATTNDAMRRQVPQIPRDADLVTLTLGGNDAGFGAVLRTCTSAGRDALCTAAVRAGQTAAVTHAATAVAATVALVRRRAPHARIVVLGYPRLFEPGPCSITGVPSERRRVLVNRGADVLDVALRTAARTSGATFVDVRSRFAGHGVCAPPDRAWINGPGPGPDAYHPNTAGHELGYLPALSEATPS